MGFPVLIVTEMKDGIKVRQDRYLETGPAEQKDNQTIWYVAYVSSVRRAVHKYL